MENSSNQTPHKRAKSGHGIQELPPNKQSFIHVRINCEGYTNPTKDSLYRTKFITKHSTAFDTVNHSILPEVIENYFGITNTALKWISSYLQKRKFSFHIDGSSSNIKAISISVPQDSILGPMLFNFYVSTLMEIIPETEENFVSGYADTHASIYIFHPENTENISSLASNIACIQDWMDKYQLKMNSSKTEFIVFGLKHQLQTYTLNSLKIDDREIMAKSVIKYLVHTWMNFST